MWNFVFFLRKIIFIWSFLAFFPALFSETNWFQLRTGRCLSSKVQVIITPPCFQLSEKSWFFLFFCNFPPKDILFLQFDLLRFRIAKYACFSVVWFAKVLFFCLRSNRNFQNFKQLWSPVDFKILRQQGWIFANVQNVKFCVFPPLEYSHLIVYCIFSRFVFGNSLIPAANKALIFK